MKCPSCGYANPEEARNCQICGHSLTSSQPYRPTEKQLDPSGSGTLEPDSIFAGRYQVVRQLGQGGMGEVYLVRDQKMEGRELALKLISASLIRDDDAKRRFVQEVEAAQRLKHQNIVSVYHLDEVEGRDFFTMEHLPGRSLRELINERKEAGGTFSLQEARSLLLPVLSALSHAHAQGIIHRDLKPENIVVSGDDLASAEVKVLDFGLARIMSPSRMTTSAVAMGTAYYMSPEQLSGEAEVDERCDVFAAGAILYELLTSKIPTGRFKMPSQLVPDLPRGIDQIVDNTLATEKEERYSSAQEMRQALAQLPESEKAAESQERAGRQRQRQESSRTRPVYAETAPSARGDKQGLLSRKSTILGAFLILAAVLVFAGIRLSDTGQERTASPENSEQETPASEQKYALRVNTDPAVADVEIVNRDIDYRRGIELKPGRYHLRAMQSGYEPVEKWVTIEGTDESISMSLAKRTYKLTVNTEPANADVEIVNRDIDYRRGMELEPGKYHLRATYSGYEPTEKWISLEDSDETVSMSLEERTYALTVDTVPASADVEIVNRDVDYRRGIELEPGRYQIRISEQGYETRTEWITLGESDKRVSYTLQEKGPPPLGRSEVVLISDLEDDRIREVLQKAGIDVEDYSGDEYRRMRKAIEAFQRENDLAVDGKLGPNTWSEMKMEAGLTQAGATGTSESSASGDTWTEPVTGMKFVYVPGGCYQMGMTEAEKNSLKSYVIQAIGKEEYETYKKRIDAKINSHTPRHEVCVDGCWMGKYEVTQGQWEQIMGSNPSAFDEGANYPVERVSWDDCQDFIDKLNAKSSRTFRLPTEAEWEYAARSGGKSQKYAGGNDVDRLAWHDGNSGGHTHEVGTKAPNRLGIYDMSGNVLEWCKDIYVSEAYSRHSRNNPVITSGGSRRVNRGGSWSYNPMGVRTSSREYHDQDFSSNGLGFRLCLPQSGESEDSGQ